jgi:DNA-binding NarL/FixJ family response regulator
VADALSTLTPQQFRVVSMLVEGLLNKQIAYELDVKEATIKAHMTEIFRKLGVHSRTQSALALSSLSVELPADLATPPD